MAKKETAFGSDQSYRDYAAQGRLIGNAKNHQAILLHLKNMLGPDIPSAQRSSAIMQHCSDIDITLFEHVVPELIKVIENPVHNSGPRVVFRILERLKIVEDHLGSVVDLAFKYLIDHNSAVAEKAFAMGTIAKQLKHFPELKNELALVCTDLYPNGSSGIKARIRAINKRHDLGMSL